MDQFQKQVITRTFYLQQIGAISLKADRAARRIVTEKEGETVANVTLEEAVSDDSLSETRPLPADSDRDTSASDVETAAVAHPVPVPAPLSSHPLAAALGIGRSKAPKEKPSGPNWK